MNHKILEQNRSCKAKHKVEPENYLKLTNYHVNNVE